MLISRLRVPGARLLATMNPASRNHWIRKKWILEAATKNLISFHFLMTDNPSNTAEYMDDMRASYSGVFFQRMINGEWTNAAGAVYSEWDPARHVIPFGRMPRMQDIVGIGMDYGTTNATTALMLGISDEKQPRLDWLNLPGYVDGAFTHYWPQGAFVAASGLADIFKRRFPEVLRVSRVYGEPDNMLSNGVFRGAADGVVPSDWTLQAGQASYSKGLVPRTDGIPGFWWEIDVPVGGEFSASAPVGLSLVVGDMVQAMVEFQCTDLEQAPATGFRSFASIDMRWAPNYISHEAMGHTLNSNQNHPTFSRAGILATPTRPKRADDTVIQRSGSTFAVEVSTSWRRQRCPTTP
jgi:hypothetical protein